MSNISSAMEAPRPGNIARTSQVTPTQVQSPQQSPRLLPISSPAAATSAGYGGGGGLTATVAKILFFLHLLTLATLVIFLSVHGSLHRTHSFHPSHWYLPLFTSVCVSFFSSLTFLSLTLKNPTFSFKTSLRLSPLLTLGAAVLLLSDGTGHSFGFAMTFLFLAVVQSLYACWITPRLPHAYEILTVSIASAQVPLVSIVYVSVALIAGSIYCIFWTLGAGGLAEDDSSRFSPLYLIALLLSLAWTMHVIKYIVHVSISRLAYRRLTYPGTSDGGSGPAFRLAATSALGDICTGAAIAPVVAATRGTARAMGVVAGGTDEFLFSCTSCFDGVAERMVERGNRWGLVHVAAYDKGFGVGSRDVWEMFLKQGMKRLVDVDLTGSFCFLYGTAVGSMAALAAGGWVFALDKRYVAAAASYAFLFGYFLTRIAMAWPQACVATFHVAFAEDPLNQRLGSCVHDRLRELGREELTRD